MNIKVRCLNDAGLTVFRQWLEKPDAEPPYAILENDSFSEPLAQDYVIDTSLRWETTFELGNYLNNVVFAGVEDTVRLRAAASMWAWISLAALPNLLRKTKAKQGKPLDAPHYVEPDGTQGQRLAYRLIARTAWDLSRLHGERAVVALGSKKSPWGEMAEQLCSRQQVFAHAGFWNIAHRLYLDGTGQIRRGVTSQRPDRAKRDPGNLAGRGGVRRLPMTFRQFDRTYNTREMSLQQMLSVLPSEYRRWIS